MVKSSFAVLVTAVAASELDESGLLQNRKVSRHGGLQCFTVQKGDVAPVEGEFIDASDERVAVHAGDVADEDGQFCVSAEVAALLERTHGLEYAETSNFDGAVKKKKKKPLGKGVLSDEEIAEHFSLSTIGPFPLVKRTDLTVTSTADNAFVVETNETEMSGSLSTSMSLDEDGASYWLGASEVDWAYQPSAGADDATGSFEAYGGFIFNDAVYEIGSSEDSPEMTMHFGWPFKMTEKQWANCKNPAPVTIQAMLDAGAQEYCWEVDHDYCERGCFIYKTAKGYQGFYVKDFALESIGPFCLEEVMNVDTIGPVTVKGKKWTSSEGRTGFISTGMKDLGTVGRNFWFNSAEVTWAYQGKDFETGSYSFEKYGGFLLRTDDGTVTSVLEIADADRCQYAELTVEFGHPFEISKKEWKKCQNPADVTISAMTEVGAKKYCWEQHWERCPRGCFFYQTTDGYQAFAVQDFAMASLGPFGLTEHLSHADSSDFTQSASTSTWTLDNVTGRLSALAGVSNWAGLENAADVQWMYPAEEADDAAGSFEKTGGFLIGDKGTWRIMEIDGSSDTKIYFDDPMHITEAQFEAGCGGTYQPITLSSLILIGTEQYCWVVPGTQDWCGDHGCFIYKTRTGYQSFAVHGQ